MNISKYRAFATVAEMGGFSQAAGKLCCTQSAASKMVRDLEEAWGVALFIRQKTGVELTAEGARLLPYARAVLAADGSLQSAASQLRGLATGLVRIAAFGSVATHWLPRVIRRFHENHPGIRYEVLMGDLDEIGEWVLSGRADLGFLAGPVPAGLSAIPAMDDELLLAVPANHPFARLPDVPVKMLDQQPFMLLEGTSRSYVSDLLEAAGVHPLVGIKTMEDYAILPMVGMGLGCAILPQLVLNQPFDGVCVKALRPRAFRRIALAVRGRAPLSLAARRFVETFAAELGGELHPDFPEGLAAVLAQKP